VHSGRVSSTAAVALGVALLVPKMNAMRLAITSSRGGGSHPADRTANPQTDATLTARSNGQAALVQDTNWAIRRGTASDFPAIAELFEATYGVRRAPESLHWLYEANPAGQCQLWLAEDPRSGQVLGSRPVFPWRLWINDQETHVAQLGDAMTRPEFQGRGIFGSLVRAAFTALLEEGIPFSFSFSNPRSLSVYKKIKVGVGQCVGTHEVLEFRRMVRPLSAEALLDRTPLRGMVGAVDRVTRACLRPRLSLPRGLSLAPVERFDGEFDEVWERARHSYSVLTVRDTAYLNWRFIDTPNGSFRILSVRQGGVLAGYVTFELDSLGCGWIADVFALAQSKIISALLRGAVACLAEDGAVKVSVWTPAAHTSYALLREIGFIPRPDVFPMAVHVYRDGHETEAALKERQWWAWFGDRDVERQ